MPINKNYNANRSAMLSLCDVRARPWPGRVSWDEKTEKVLLEEGYLEVRSGEIRLSPMGEKELNTYLRVLRPMAGGIQGNQKKMLQYVESGEPIPKESWGLNEVRILWSLYSRGLVDGDIDNGYVVSPAGYERLSGLVEEAKAAVQLPPQPPLPSPQQLCSRPSTSEDIPKVSAQEPQEKPEQPKTLEDDGSEVMGTLKRAEARFEELKSQGHQNITAKVVFSFTSVEKKEQTIL